MKPVFILANSFLILIAASFSAPVFAQQDAEEACLAKADEMQIADDKYDEFIQKCIQEATAKSE